MDSAQVRNRLARKRWDKLSGESSVKLGFLQIFDEMGDLMSVSARAFKLGLGAALALLSAGGLAAQSDTSEVVANVGGVKVTMAELEQEESAKLLSAHYQYYQAETKALDELIDKKLIEQKAKSENITVEQLVDRDIKSPVKDPTEDQMKVYYEGLETEQPYEAVRGKILEKIRELRTQKARSAYVRALRAQSTVYITLAPPRVSVDLQNAEMIGPAKPQVTMVEFADYECPYCQKVAADLKRLQADLGDKVAFSYKDFPLPMHARAEKAAEATRCASKQGKFWEFHDELFRSKELDVDQLKAQARALKLDAAEFDKCLDTGEQAAAVERDRKEGARLGLTGTPSFFINGHFLSGALDYASLRQVVEQQLAAPAQGTGSAGK
jgi:protein-disulfide isomerase